MSNADSEGSGSGSGPHEPPANLNGDDLEYLQLRAEQEVEKAQSSTDPRVVAAHFQLANAYLERLDRLLRHSRT